jgi:polyhydroxyalkanoate synthesis regulator protein
MLPCCIAAFDASAVEPVMSKPAVIAPFAAPPVVFTRYANRRLYDGAAGRYVNRDNLAGMIRQGEAFVIYDAATDEDFTREVLDRIADE